MTIHKKKKNAILATPERTKLLDVRKFGTNLDEMAKAIHTIFDSHRRSQKNKKVKTSILLTSIGKKGREVYSTFEFENEQFKYNLEIVIEKFSNYCQPRKNLTLLTQIFYLQAKRPSKI